MRSELFEEAWKQNRHVWESTKCLAQAMYLAGEKHQQSKVDELQKKNAWLSDVAERENNRANNLQQDKTSTTILLGKTIQEKNELQKRVDAVKALIEEYRDPPTEDKTFQHALSIVAYELEQALKGGEA